MVQHTYNQYCPVAHALDLVGDRWAFLIVRDLLLGPKRFIDLRGSLPGIGTNILTARLKELEAAGVIHHRVLPPPAASAVYELTPYGRELEEPIATLARWGAKTLGPPQSEQYIRAESVMLAVYTFFRDKDIRKEPRTYEVSCEGEGFSETFHVLCKDGAVDVSQEPAPAPDLVLHADVETVFALSGRQMTVQHALACGSVRVKGKPEIVKEFVAVNEEKDS